MVEFRKQVYEEAKLNHPERWSGKTRNWEPIKEVYLNPEGALNRRETEGYTIRKEAS